MKNKKEGNAATTGLVENGVRNSGEKEIKEEGGEEEDEEEEEEGVGKEGEERMGKEGEEKKIAEEGLCTMHSAVEITHGRDEVTNLSFDFIGALDYVFVSTGWKILASCVHPPDFPKREQMGRSKWAKECFPSEKWPSDHLLIEAVIELSPTRIRV